MATIRVAVRKRWQTRPYEYEECELAYDEDVEQATLDERARKKGVRIEDAAAELATALHVSLGAAAAAAMERSLARTDPRDGMEGTRAAGGAKDPLTNAGSDYGAKPAAFRTPPGRRP